MGERLKRDEEMLSLFPQYSKDLSRFVFLLKMNGYSDGTIYMYKQAFWDFVLFCESIKKKPKDASDDDFLEFLRRLKEDRNLTQRTLLVKYSAVKFLLEKVYGKKVKTKLSFKIKESEKVRKMKIVSENDIEKILRYTAKKDPTLFRFIILAYGIGLRVSEALKLKWSDIKTIEGYIRVYGKGGKVRFVPIPSVLRTLIRFWKSKNMIKEDDYVFPSPNRKDKPLTRQAIDKKLKKILKELFGSKKYSAHSFRHAFATHFLKKYKDIYSLSKILGHSDIKITTIYTHIVPHKAEFVLPIDRLVVEKARSKKTSSSSS